MRQFRGDALARRLVSLVLILSVLVPMTGAVQMLPAVNGDEPVVMTLNVCETGVPMAGGQAHAPWVLQTYSFPKPLFLRATENGKEQSLTDAFLITLLDRPPKAV